MSYSQQRWEKNLKCEVINEFALEELWEFILFNAFIKQLQKLNLENN